MMSEPILENQVPQFNEREVIAPVNAISDIAADKLKMHLKDAGAAE